jgi:hypothetical protein
MKKATMAASPKTSQRETWNWGLLVLVRSNPPRIKDITPPMPSAPNPETTISAQTERMPGR